MRVLMVEGEEQITTAQQRGLAAEGFRVDVVPNGAEGLRSGRKNAYDVIVLHFTSARTDGYQVCEALRAGGVWTPVLILTAKPTDRIRTDVFDVRADDYLTMPMAFVELMARLRALIRRTAPDRPVVLPAGDLTLDPFRRSVERAGTRLALTSREFSLLHFLIRHRGDVLSKEQILAEVWNIHWDGRPNIVEVYISYLRKKVDKPFGSTMIETVRGVGYRLSN